MLSNQPYYHGITRKIIVAFGQIFSDIKIQRFNKSNTVEQLIDVPVSYGNKEKWYSRAKEESEIDTRVLISLPRIGFEIAGIQYDASRKLNKFTQYRPCSPNTNGQFLSTYTPVPYTLTLNVYVITKTLDDMFQIVEQIIPFFAPQYDLTINALPELGIVKDVPISLAGVQLDDSYEGPMATRREVVGTLTFTAKVEFIGPYQNVTSQMITSVKTKIDAGGTVGREVDVTAVGIPDTVPPTPDNFTIIEEFFDIPAPIAVNSPFTS